VSTIFAFDAASSSASCAFLRGGELVAQRDCDARGILLGAAELVRSAGLDLGELDALVVGTGPGSFTSIRIGLATARALSFALRIPAAGVSSFHAYAGGRPVIDAKRGEVFTEGPAVCRPEELEVAGQRLVGDGAIRYRRLFEAAGAEVPAEGDPVHRPAASRLVAYALDYGDAELIEPQYVRAPDARPPR
jgi:tRNA threonylcarbamoyladenosine biosynthesis protein TsaB